MDSIFKFLKLPTLKSQEKKKRKKRWEECICFKDLSWLLQTAQIFCGIYDKIDVTCPFYHLHLTLLSWKEFQVQLK